ncbi:MAG: hypothetical protein MI748_02145 [Opitutales bacterium]|nr:hypothetical protein [Opitutales bacterium]
MRLIGDDQPYPVRQMNDGASRSGEINPNLSGSLIHSVEGPAPCAVQVRHRRRCVGGTVYGASDAPHAVQ